MPYKLPELPYPYDALEPYIDARTMEVHHTKHHQKYTDKLNEAIARHPDLGEGDIEDLLRDLSVIPTDIRTAVRNNGGGFANHNFFWSIMSPNGGEPAGEVDVAIKETFTSMARFREKFLEAATNLFGSGWTWLALSDNGKLEIMNTANQDSPLTVGAIPLLSVDVWEHAYYLKYQNRRPEYLEAWWNVVNWKEVEKKYLQAAK